MKFGKVTLGLAAVALAAAPAFAQAAFAPAIAPLSGDQTELEDGETIVLAVGAAAAIVLGIVLLSDGDEEPVSP